MLAETGSLLHTKEVKNYIAPQAPGKGILVWSYLKTPESLFILIILFVFLLTETRLLGADLQHY